MDKYLINILGSYVVKSHYFISIHLYMLYLIMNFQRKEHGFSTNIILTPSISYLFVPLFHKMKSSILIQIKS